MNIPKRLLDDWNKHKSNGDLTKIADMARKRGGLLKNTRASTVADAFSNGKCRFELFIVMASFYKKRRMLISKVQMGVVS